MQLQKTLVALSVAMALAAAPFHGARAGIIGKAFVLGSIVVGGVALNKAQASKHCLENPSDPQCAKIKGAEASPVAAGAPPAAVPAPGAAPAPKAKDPNAMIDAGAAKAKDATAKATAWFAKKRAERAAKKAAQEAAAGQAPGAAPAAPAPVPAK